MYPLTGNHCLLYDCFLSGQCVPFSICQLNSTEELQRATFRKGRMVSQNMLRDQEEDIAFLYNRMLWISTLSSVVLLQGGGRW